jgi:hypothetical protein
VHPPAEHFFLYFRQSTLFSVNSFSFDDCLFLFVAAFLALVLATMLSRLTTVLFVRVEVRRSDAHDDDFLLSASIAAASAFLS